MGASKRLFEQLREELSERLISIENGNEIGALEIYNDVNLLQKDLTKFKTEAEKLAFNEVELNVELSGYDVKIKNGGRRFIFKGIKEWDEKNKELKEIEERAKQAFLSMEKGLMTASEEGEEIELPIISYTKDSLLITKKK